MSTDQFLEKRIRLIEDTIECPSYYCSPGWYFYDRDGSLNGPFNTREEALEILKKIDIELIFN